MTARRNHCESNARSRGSSRPPSGSSRPSSASRSYPAGESTRSSSRIRSPAAFVTSPAFARTSASPSRVEPESELVLEAHCPQQAQRVVVEDAVGDNAKHPALDVAAAVERIHRLPVR